MVVEEERCGRGGRGGKRGGLHTPDQDIDPFFVSFFFLVFSFLFLRMLSGISQFYSLRDQSIEPVN